MFQWLNLFLFLSPHDPYALGVGEKASERLNLQHALLRRDFENHVLEAGLKKGMVVLDLGCGNGAMTFWVASQVGEAGRVIAVDRSREQLEIAKKQALAKGITNIEFICSDAQDLELELGSIDFIYCRFLLMHLKDPLRVIQKVLPFLKEGGVFAAQEPINSTVYLHPEDPIFIQKLRDHMQNISIQHGVDYDIGKRLYSLFYQAGYRSLQLHFSQRAISIPEMKDFVRQFYEDIGPAALRSGAISKEELMEQRTSIQEYPEKKDSYFGVPQQAHITGYKNSNSVSQKKEK